MHKIFTMTMDSCACSSCVQFGHCQRKWHIPKEQTNRFSVVASHLTGLQPMIRSWRFFNSGVGWRERWGTSWLDPPSSRRISPISWWSSFGYFALDVSHVKKKISSVHSGGLIHNHLCSKDGAQEALILSMLAFFGWPPHLVLIQQFLVQRKLLATAIRRSC